MDLEEVSDRAISLTAVHANSKDQYTHKAKVLFLV